MTDNTPEKTPTRPSWKVEQEVRLFSMRAETRFGWFLLALAAFAVISVWWNNAYTLERVSTQPPLPVRNPFLTFWLVYAAVAGYFSYQARRLEKLHNVSTPHFLGRHVFKCLILFFLLGSTQGTQNARTVRQISDHIDSVEAKYGFVPPDASQALEWLKSGNVKQAQKQQIDLIASASTEDMDVLPFLLADKLGVSNQKIKFVVENRMVRENDRKALSEALIRASNAHNKQQADPQASS